MLAEREGFEPSVRVNVHTLSRRAPSATRSPFLNIILIKEAIATSNNTWPSQIELIHNNETV